jgi:nitronate monooxygenase
MQKVNYFESTFTKLIHCKYPIIAGPMFLVSDEELVIAACEAGIVGAFPSLNWRTTEEFKIAVRTVKNQVKDLPFAVNIIANKSNPRAEKDLHVALDEGAPMFITSLGNPKQVITEAHKTGAKVFCDVTTLDYARKVQDLGADGVIAVSHGAGGHAGSTNPLVMIPYLKKHLNIPIILAGGIATGEGLAAALVLGADAVQIGTRFIASTECKVDSKYKAAILRARPEDIVLTTRISGTPAAVINTPYFEKVGLHLNPVERFLIKNKYTKKWSKLLVNLRGMKMLRTSAEKPTWKEVWSAGQGVGLIDSVKPVRQIVEDMVSKCRMSFDKTYANPSPERLSPEFSGKSLESLS